MTKNMRTYRFETTERGYSLVELLVTMAIVSFIMAAVFSVYISNTRAVDVESEHVEVQQMQRISLDFIARELRLAGYDKTDSGLPTIVDARSNYIYYTLDRNSDGDLDDPNEHIAFCVYNSANGIALGFVQSDQENNASVVNGGAVGGGALGLDHPGQHNHQEFAPVEAIEFFYTLEDGTTTTDPGPGQMDSVRSVVVTVLSRTDTPDPQFNDTVTTYPRPSGAADWGPFNDNFRRRLMSMTIRFRNMGLR